MFFQGFVAFRPMVPTKQQDSAKGCCKNWESKTPTWSTFTSCYLGCSLSTESWSGRGKGQTHKSPSSDHFKTFLKRCNVFNTVLANGKGFAFLQLVDNEARRPVAYASQRFASSSYEQWLEIEKSYSALWKAFDKLYPNRPEDEQYQYMIAGSDFIADLLSFLDILDPIVDLMLRVQSLDVPVWKLKLWWPKIRAKLEKAANGDADCFPRLQEVGERINPGDHYQGWWRRTERNTQLDTARRDGN